MNWNEMWNVVHGLKWTVDWTEHEHDDGLE